MNRKLVLGVASVTLLIIFLTASSLRTIGDISEKPRDPGVGNEVSIQNLMNGSSQDIPQGKRCQYFKDASGKKWKACFLGVVEIDAGKSTGMDAEIRTKPGLGK